MHDYGHLVAKACAAHEDDKARRTEEFYQDVEIQIGIEKMHVAVNSWDWVNDHIADPAEELALIYKQIALYYNEPETIGKIVKTIFENKLRKAAEYEVERII